MARAQRFSLSEVDVAQLSEISIGDFSMEIDSDLDPAYVRELEAHINDTYDQIRQGMDCSHNHAMVLTLLHVADELFEEKRNFRRLKENIFIKANRLI